MEFWLGLLFLYTVDFLWFIEFLSGDCGGTIFPYSRVPDIFHLDVLRPVACLRKYDLNVIRIAAMEEENISPISVEPKRVSLKTFLSDK